MVFRIGYGLTTLTEETNEPKDDGILGSITESLENDLGSSIQEALLGVDFELSLGYAF